MFVFSSHKTTEQRKHRVGQRRQRFSRCRPSVEGLENRLVLTTFVVNTFADSVAVNLHTGQDAAGRISLRSCAPGCERHRGGRHDSSVGGNVHAHACRCGRRQGGPRRPRHHGPRHHSGRGLFEYVHQRQPPRPCLRRLPDPGADLGSDHRKWSRSDRRRHSERRSASCSARRRAVPEPGAGSERTARWRSWWRRAGRRHLQHGRQFPGDELQLGHLECGHWRSGRQRTDWRLCGRPQRTQWPERLQWRGRRPRSGGDRRQRHAERARR